MGTQIVKVRAKTESTFSQQGDNKKLCTAIFSNSLSFSNFVKNCCQAKEAVIVQIEIQEVVS